MNEISKFILNSFSAPCTTKKQDDEGDDKPKNEVHNCVFPFKYKGKTYEKCTTVDSDNEKPWCAYDIQPGTEVPQDGKHWGDCNFDCPGGGKQNDRLQSLYT